MLKSIVDAGERLFGRRFLLVTFVPSLLFWLVSVALLGGAHRVVDPIQQLATRGAPQLTFEVIQAVTGSLLLAFLVTGSLGSIRGLYRGDWPTGIVNRRPARWLLDWQREALRRAHADEAAALRRLNDAGWAIKLGFAPSGDADLVEAKDVAPALARVEAQRARLLQSIEDGETRVDDSYRALLASARALQTTRAKHADRPDCGTSEHLDGLIDRLRRDYRDNAVLKEAAQRMYDDAERVWRQAFNERVQNFPTDESWLRPTHLGNVIGATETYPLKRYGINWDALWSRLLFVLPGPARQRIDAATMIVDFALVMSFFSIATMLVADLSVALAVAAGDPAPNWSLAVLMLALGFLCSFVFEWVAVVGARELGTQMEAAVDLYRLNLLDALQIERPRTPSAEREIWKSLRQFIAWDAAELSNITFVRPPEPSPAKETAMAGAGKRNASERKAEANDEEDEDDTSSEARTEDSDTARNAERHDHEPEQEDVPAGAEEEQDTAQEQQDTHARG